MKRHPSHFFAILAISLCASSPATFGQNAGQKPVVNLKGTEFFHVLLHRAGLTPLKSIADLSEDQHKTLLIIFGDPRVLAEIDAAIGLKAFLEAEGAILVATIDPSPELGAALGIHTQGPLVVNPRQGASFLNNPRCPFVVPSGVHPLFRGVKMLATNAPTHLTRDEDCDYSPLAVFLPGYIAMRNRPLPNPLVFAVGNSSPTGKVLVVGGHGMFMNGPIANRENFTFARNCIEWFTKGEGGERKRDRVLFIEEGKIHTKLDVRWKEVPQPPIPPLEWFNRLIGGLDRENFLNNFLLTALGGQDVEDKALRATIGKQRLIYWTAVILSALVIFHGLRRLFKARYRVDTRVPLVASHLAQTISTEPVVEQRQRGMLQEGNLWEAARALARQPFAAYAENASQQPPPRPRVTIAGGWGQRRALAKLVDKLWDFGYGAKPFPVSRHDFLQIEAEVEQVRVALTSGVLKLQEPSPPAGPYFVRNAGRAPAAT